MVEEICVACGAVIPEGRQVCTACEKRAEWGLEIAEKEKPTKE